MGAERQLDGPVILDHLAAAGERDQRHFGLGAQGVGGGEQGQGRLAQPAHPPQGLAPVEAQGGEGVGVGELLERGDRHAGTAPDILDRLEGRFGAGGEDPGGMEVGKASDHSKAEAEGEMRSSDARHRGGRDHSR